MVVPDSTEKSKKDHSKGNRITIKVLIPPYVAGTIIGKSGEQIKDLKTKTKAHIKVSGRDEIFPYTDERIVLLIAPAENAMEAVTFIHSKLRSRTPPRNSRFREQEIKKRAKEMKIIIADTTAGKIIGKKGENVKKIQEDHNVKVFLTSKDDWGIVPGERVATITGEENDVNCAIEDILTKIQEDPYARLNRSLAYPPYPMFDYHGYMGPPEFMFRGRREQYNHKEDSGNDIENRKNRSYDFPPRNNGYQPEPARFYNRNARRGGRGHPRY